MDSTAYVVVGGGLAAESALGENAGRLAAFAHTGNTSHEGLPAWPRYDARQRATMILGGACKVQDAPREPERHFLETVTVPEE